MTIAKRNSAIKSLLEREYGKGKVWVRGSRGTAYGWVHVYIDVGNKFDEEDGQGLRPFAHSDERRKVERLISEANIEIGTYGYNDPGSDYGYGSKINIDFRVPYDVLEKRKAA